MLYENSGGGTDATVVHMLICGSVYYTFQLRYQFSSFFFTVSAKKNLATRFSHFSSQLHSFFTRDFVFS